MLNSILNLDFNFKIETKFLITFEKVQFQMFSFEKCSHDNKFHFFCLNISNFEKHKLEQKNWNKLFIAKTKTSELFAPFTTKSNLWRKTEHFTTENQGMELQYYQLCKSSKCCSGTILLFR